MPKGAGKGRAGQATDGEVVIAGSTAGLLARFVVAPLDVVKIRLQLQTHSFRDAHTVSGPTYSGVLSPLRAIAQQEGITALWKGNVPAELMYLAYGGAQFFAYRNIHVFLDNSAYHLPESAQSFVAGTVAGTVATAATYPLDLLRTRFAVQGHERVYRSLAHAVSHIYAHEGMRGFFRGLTSAVAQIAPNFGLFFAVYEPVKTALTRHAPESAAGWESAAAGGLASTAAKAAIFPLDLARKRLQVQGPTRAQYVHRNIPIYATSIGVLRDVWRTEGYRGWYKGLTVSLVKAAPNSAVTMWTYEQVMRYMQRRKQRRKSNDE